MVKQNKQSFLYSVSRKLQNGKVLNFTRAQQFRISSYLSKRPSKLYPYEMSKDCFLIYLWASFIQTVYFSFNANLVKTCYISIVNVLSALLNKAFPSFLPIVYGGARCSSVVRAFVIVQWVFGSILYAGPIKLFLVLAIAPRLIEKCLWYVQSCLWDGAYKRTLAANQKE